MLLLSDISCKNFSCHESLTETSKNVKTLSILVSELLPFYTILLVLNVFDIILYATQNCGVSLGLHPLLSTVLIYYFSMCFKFIIGYIFNPGINKVIAININIIIIFFSLHFQGQFYLISKHYLISKMSSTLLRMKAVPRIAVFCRHVTIGMSIFFRQNFQL